MKLSYSTHRLVLKDKFTISHGSYDFRDTFILKMRALGHWGFGEATVIPYLGVSLKGLIADFKKIAPEVEKMKWDHPEDLWPQINSLIPENTFLKSAIDCASWDCYGKSLDKPIYRLLELDPTKCPVSSFTIGHGSEEEMKRKIKNSNWPVFKIKTSSDEDIELIKKLREVTEKPFWIDANCSWESNSLYEHYHTLNTLKVELLEQPLPIGGESAQKKELHSPSLPLIADESCRVPEDIPKLAPWFDGVNIKLMKCGGISPALKMIQKAKSMGLLVMGGCMTESSIGISAMSHLSPLFDFLDLDGAVLLSNDPAAGTKVRDGMVQISDRSGLGCTLLKQ